MGWIGSTNMIELIGLIVAFIVIFLLRFKNFDFAATILIAAGIIGITSGKSLTIFSDVFYVTVRDKSTWELCAAVGFITVFGYVLKETNHMVELIDKLRSFLPSRFLLAFIPALFGILAMPGGALMSAPFNEPESDRLKLKPEHRTFINIWFRHVWYWASPISPSTLLACSIAGIGLTQFITINFPIFIITWIIGFATSWRWLRSSDEAVHGKKDYYGSLVGLSPILVTVALTLFSIPVWVSVAFGIAIVIVLRKVDPGQAVTFFIKGVKLDLVAAVFATLFFRYMIVESGSVRILLDNILSMGVPLLILFIVVPLLVGTISAQPTLGIGLVFPILIPLVAPINVNWMTIMFAGINIGYTGSPLHLCLILTNHYYRSDLNKVYRHLLPSLLLLAVLIIIYHVALGRLW
jgi:integral membrane protein (TIGR00529 family)